MSYITPPVFSANGGYLSAYKLRALANNDEYFSGLADEIQMVQRMPGGGSINGAETIFTIFDGYIFLTQDHLHYCLYVNKGFEGTGHCHLYFDYGGAHQIHMTPTIGGTDDGYSPPGVSGDGSWIDGGEPGSTAFDVSNDTNYPKNALYRVYAEIHWTGQAPSAELRYFYEDYYPTTLAYTAPTAFTDGTVSDYTHFDKLSDNDTYYNAIVPDNFPFWAANTTWTGWVKHSNARRKFYFSVQNSGANELHISYGGTNLMINGASDHFADGIVHEGSITIPDATWTEGTWYAVSATGTGAVSYLAMGASAKSSGYTPSGQFNAGQFGWGTTANQRARLDLLGSNDTDINTRFARTNYVRANHAVKKSTFPILGSSTMAVYKIRHSKSYLYYRGKGLGMGWGTLDGTTYTNSQGLTDYDGSHPYQTLDLASVQNLAMGQIYTITSDHDGSNCIEWAAERDS